MMCCCRSGHGEKARTPNVTLHFIGVNLLGNLPLMPRGKGEDPKPVRPASNQHLINIKSTSLYSDIAQLSPYDPARVTGSHGGQARPVCGTRVLRDLRLVATPGESSFSGASAPYAAGYHAAAGYPGGVPRVLAPK